MFWILRIFDSYFLYGAGKIICLLFWIIKFKTISFIDGALFETERYFILQTYCLFCSKQEYNGLQKSSKHNIVK